jgi:hypothetical protein
MTLPDVRRRSRHRAHPQKARFRAEKGRFSGSARCQGVAGKVENGPGAAPKRRTAGP